MHIFTVQSQFMVQILINLSKSIFLSSTPFICSQDSLKHCHQLPEVRKMFDSPLSTDWSVLISSCAPALC